jgi:hypothetical protein
MHRSAGSLFVRLRHFRNASRLVIGSSRLFPRLCSPGMVAIASWMCLAESTRIIPPPVMCPSPPPRFDAKDTGSPLVFLGWSE